MLDVMVAPYMGKLHVVYPVPFALYLITSVGCNELTQTPNEMYEVLPGTAVDTYGNAPCNFNLADPIRECVTSTLVIGGLFAILRIALRLNDLLL